VTLENYKIVLYRQEDGSRVAEVPAISGCYAPMPTREEALAELSKVFEMIAAAYRGKGAQLPADSTPQRARDWSAALLQASSSTGRHPGSLSRDAVSRRAAPRFC
jgi:predicted RNase H-like HicB family nuclease